ncbi:hypothetical protein [Burkholderia ubonensis]|uniref:Uncharacterized protein n=1 Tax=Burkholderia ubonensis TaxID=101571 RepID=A0AAW3NLJ9_9BURK|nr:hypothetical protein [Burkholderia ubonensis]KVT57771.1 hypothetical protein WK53_29590 [Burkholderia ubonensis]
MHVSGEGLETTAIDRLREIVGGCEMPRGDLAFGHAGEVFEQRQFVVVERGRMCAAPVRRPSRVCASQSA